MLGSLRGLRKEDRHVTACWSGRRTECGRVGQTRACIHQITAGRAGNAWDWMGGRMLLLGQGAAVVAPHRHQGSKWS